MILLIFKDIVFIFVLSGEITLVSCCGENKDDRYKTIKI